MGESWTEQLQNRSECKSNHGVANIYRQAVLRVVKRYIQVCMNNHKKITVNISKKQKEELKEFRNDQEFAI